MGERDTPCTAHRPTVPHSPQGPQGHTAHTAVSDGRARRPRAALVPHYRLHCLPWRTPTITWPHPTFVKYRLSLFTMFGQ